MGATPNVQLLIDVAMSLYLNDGMQVGAGTCAQLKGLLSHFIERRITYSECLRLTSELTGVSQPIERLQEILLVPNDPIPSAGPAHHASDRLSGRKHRSWTALEDTGLIAPVFRFGPEDWKSVAQFVGNGRTRGQCSQRWLRGIHPKLSRCPWTNSEELHLTQLVQVFGEKSWTQIAARMGNRSDVQCRYHYKQMQKERAAHRIVPAKNVQSGLPPPPAPIAPPVGKNAALVRTSLSAPLAVKPAPPDKKEGVMFDRFARVEESEKDTKWGPWY
jgi:hypothetical protein